MNYIGFDEVKLDDVYKSLKENLNYLETLPTEDVFNSYEAIGSPEYILKETKKMEFVFFSSIFNKKDNSADPLTPFLPELLGMIADPINDTGFIAIKNFLGKSTTSYVDLVAGKCNFLPTMNENKQISNISRGFTYGNLNRGFRVRSYCLVDLDGKPVKKGHLKKSVADIGHKIQFNQHKVGSIFPAEYRESYKELMLTALEKYIEFVRELKTVYEENKELKWLIARVNLVFLIDYVEGTFDVKVLNFKKVAHVEETNVWDDAFKINFGLVLAHLVELRSQIEA